MAKEISPPKNLMEGLFDEMTRVREIIKEYETIGALGAFASAMMRKSIELAETSIKENDVVKMLSAYGDLKAYEL